VVAYLRNNPNKNDIANEDSVALRSAGHFEPFDHKVHNDEVV